MYVPCAITVSIAIIIGNTDGTVWNALHFGYQCQCLFPANNVQVYKILQLV